MRLELFGADIVDTQLVAGGYFAPEPLRPRVFHDAAGNHYRAPRLEQGLHLLGGPGPLAIEHPIALEAM